MTTKIAIFGASFNPPHLAHLDIVKTVLRKCNIDKVLIVPTNNYQKEYDVSFGDRLEMARLTFKGLKNVAVDDIEEKLNLNGKTFSLMEALEERNRNAVYSIIIGADCASRIKTWYRWEDLVHDYSFIVFERLGTMSKIPNIFYEDPHTVLEFSSEYAFLSSSYLRKYTNAIDSCTTNRVSKLITAKGLYGKSNKS